MAAPALSWPSRPRILGSPSRWFIRQMHAPTPN